MTVRDLSSIHWTPIISALLVALLGSPSEAQENASRNPVFPAPAWLRGEGDSLSIRLSGEIILANGKAAENAKLAITQSSPGKSIDLGPTLDGNRYEVWVPVGKNEPFCVQVFCESSDGKEIFAKKLEMHELRQRAIEGLPIGLQLIDRTIEIKPVREMISIPDTEVRITTRDRPYFVLTTDKDGIARLKLQKNEAPLHTHLYAISKDRLVADQVVDSSLNVKPRPNELLLYVRTGPFKPFPIRIVREDDNSPLTDLDISIRYQLPYNTKGFLDSWPLERRKTDAKGEVIVETFPPWLAGAFGIDTGEAHWVKANIGKLVDGVYVIPMKKSHLAGAKRISGLVIADQGSPGGYCIAMGTRQGEFAHHQLEMQFAFTDANGQFTGSFIPGATYCILTHDLRQVSDIVTMIPNPSPPGMAKTPLLSIGEGGVVELKVARGEKKVPAPYVDVELETRHRMTWLDKNGVENAANGGRTWIQRADENGKLTIYAQKGSILSAKALNEPMSESSFMVHETGPTRVRITIPQ